MRVPCCFLVVALAHVAVGGISTPEAPAAHGEDVIKVTLLGTGCPVPLMSRFGPSVLLEAGSEKLLFDAGRGSLQRLRQLNVPFGEIRKLFLTHLHSDHVVGIADLMLTGWLESETRTPLQIFGPEGTRAMMRHLSEAFEFDIRIRTEDDGIPREGAVVNTEEIREGTVYERHGLKVTAFDVDHRPIKPALGYRVDYAGRSVVVSGDTRVSENLIRFADGADLLIHEVILADLARKLEPNKDLIERVIAHHTTAEQAGEVFARVKPKLAVYSHIAPPSATAAALKRATRITYKGPLEVGEDLMVIEVGRTIRVTRHSHSGDVAKAVR